MFYAYKLYELDRTIDVNVRAQRTPVLVKATENQRLTMLNLYAQYDGFEPFIFGTDNLDINNLQAINTNAPYVADKVQLQKEKIFNECLTYLGIANVSVSKKERLISDEVERGMGGTYASRNSALSMREDFCRKMNDMFGLNMSVEFNEDVEDQRCDEKNSLRYYNNENKNHSQ